jgi:hypothetical protein
MSDYGGDAWQIARTMMDLETLWIGFLSCMGMWGAMVKESAFNVMFMAAAMAVAGLIWSWCLGSTKGSSQTEGGWKLSRTREILSCNLLSVLLAGILWTGIMRGGGVPWHRCQVRPFSLVERDGGEAGYAWWTDNSTYSWEYPEMAEPIVIKLLAQEGGVPCDDGSAAKEAYETRSLEYPKSLCYYQQDERHPEWVQQAKRDLNEKVSGFIIRSANHTGATYVETIFVYSWSFSDIRQEWFLRSTAAFVNMVDGVGDVVLLSFIPLPAILVAAGQDMIIPEQWKKMTGFGLCCVVNVLVGLEAILIGWLMPHGCSGGCFIFLICFIVLVILVNVCIDKAYFARRPYPGVLDKHNGIAPTDPGSFFGLKDLGVL